MVGQGHRGWLRTKGMVEDTRDGEGHKVPRFLDFNIFPDSQKTIFL